MYINIYICLHIYTYMHVTKINLKKAMDLKRAWRNREENLEGGKGMGENYFILIQNKRNYFLKVSLKIRKLSRDPEKVS